MLAPEWASICLGNLKGHNFSLFLKISLLGFAAKKTPSGRIAIFNDFYQFWGL